ncbi:unnamed protein product [Discosporangium mesarthrocarpum]
MFLLTQVVALGLGWLCFSYLLTHVVGDNAEIARFDPYAILGVTPGTDERSIKKAFRALSVVYHPDKNPGNKVAEDMFVKIAKAYEALTDEKAKHNWELHGNPDGKQPMEVSIALPTFLLDKEYHNKILIIYLIAMVIIVPSIVAMWYAHSKKYGEKNVMYDSYAWYNHMLSENSLLKTVPEVLAGSAEFRTLNSRPPLEDDTTKEVSKLLRSLCKEAGVMPKPKYEHPVIQKGAVLIFSHLARRDIGPALRKNLHEMLVKAPDLVDAMIELSCSRHWLKTTTFVVEFSQYLTQGMWTKDNSLLQLPHIGEQEVKAITNKTNIKTLAQYIKLPRADRRGLTNLTEEQREDVHRVCDIIPVINVKVEIFVEDEEEVAENDLVTIKVTLTRNNVPEGGRALPVYSPRYPVPREEGWWIIVGDEGRKTIFSFERVTEQGRTVSKEVKMMAPGKPGTVKLDVFVKSDSYVGLDTKKTIEFEVISASTLPAYEPHPDDLELDNEPTLFEQVMQTYDDDTDSDDEPVGTSKKVDNGKGARDDDSEDESSDEE